MDSELKSTREYFSRRACRYALALKTYPFARILDLVPYLYEIPAVARRLKVPIRRLEGLDAFGGTGYLTYSFRNSGIKFAVGDCCPQMLSLGDHHLQSVDWVETTDYFSGWAENKPESMDFILCHGGLHHVVRHLSGRVDHAASRELQEYTIRNLSRLLRPGGSLIIADVPAAHPRWLSSGTEQACPSGDAIRDLIGEKQALHLANLEISPESCGLFDIGLRIRNRFSASTPFDVPRHFFDDFVAAKTPLGHEASFIPVQELNSMVVESGLQEGWQIDFRGPWVFPSAQEAGWYFREKFAIGQTCPPGFDPESEAAMADVLNDFLGTRNLGDFGFAVNWGVVYSCYRKPC